MKLNVKQSDRTLHAHRQGESGEFVLIERERFRQSTYSRSHWGESRIYITTEEIQRLYKLTQQETDK